MFPSFPLANKSFSVQRKTVVINAQGNPIPGGPQIVATGVPVLLRDLNANVLNEQGAVVEVGMYRGSALKSAPIRVNDVLLDETENDANGKPVQYKVEQTTILPIYLKLHLRRLQVNV